MQKKSIERHFGWLPWIFNSFGKTIFLLSWYLVGCINGVNGSLKLSGQFFLGESWCKGAITPPMVWSSFVFCGEVRILVMVQRIAALDEPGTGTSKTCTSDSP